MHSARSIVQFGNDLDPVLVSCRNEGSASVPGKKSKEGEAQDRKGKGLISNHPEGKPTRKLLEFAWAKGFMSMGL
jgi:hypothetical protein